MTRIPLCNKCCKAITGKADKMGGIPFIGCKEDKKIKDFTTAKKYCPCLK